MSKKIVSISVVTKQKDPKVEVRWFLPEIDSVMCSIQQVTSLVSSTSYLITINGSWRINFPSEEYLDKAYDTIMDAFKYSFVKGVEIVVDQESNTCSIKRVTSNVNSSIKK